MDYPDTGAFWWLPFREEGQSDGDYHAACRRAKAERRKRPKGPKRKRKKGPAQTPPLRQQVYERDGRRCVKCGRKDRLSLDHVRPLSKGGAHDVRNLQTLCVPCNGAKGDSWDGVSGWPPAEAETPLAA